MASCGHELLRLITTTTTRQFSQRRCQQVGLDGTPEVLLDPNTLSKDGTSALSGVDFSKDGKMLAYGISEKGSDW